MNVRKRISEELSSFVEDSVNAYIGIIEPVVSTIPEADFNKAVSTVVAAQARTEDALASITIEAVTEAMASVTFQQEQAPPKDLKSLLIPTNQPASTPEQEYRQYSPPPKPSPVLEGQFTPPPRLTEAEGGSSTLEGPGRPDLAAPMGDEFYDPNDPIDHTPPTMTLEQEKRRKEGRPDPYRPTIHFDGQNRVEKPPELPIAPAKAVPPITPVVVDSPKEELAACLHQLQQLMIPHIESRNKDLSMLACSSLVLINRARGLAEGIKLKAVEEPEEEVLEAEVVDDPK